MSGERLVVLLAATWVGLCVSNPAFAKKPGGDSNPIGGSAARFAAAVDEDAECPRLDGLEAYTCCDGNGSFAICWNSSEREAWLSECVLEHEREHLDWFATNRPDACSNRAPGACLFRLRASEVRETECRAYRTEYGCLQNSSKPVGYRRTREAHRRTRFLRRTASAEYGCETSAW